MKSYLGTFLIATIVAAVLSPLVRQFALRIGAVSWPGGRHVHLRPIARMGGVAIFGAFFSAIAALLVLDNALGQEFRRNWVQVLGLFGGATLMCGVGALDDRKPLPAKTKLAVQIVAACVAFACGFRIEYIQLPFFGDLSMGIFSLPITILWVVGIVNAVNLIDGLDGLAAGIVFCAGVTNFVVANVSGQLFISSVMAALVGSVFGFLFHNFNPARIFMGDSGSYLLGYVMATATLIGSQHKASTAVSLLVPCLALGVPIFDTLFSMVRRWLERKPIFSPDRGHIHHRLLDMGLTHRRVVLIIYGFTAAFCIAAIAVYLGRSWQIGAALLGASLVFFGMMRFAGYFNYLQQSLRGRTSPALRQTRLVQRALPVVCVNIHTSKDVRAVFAALATFAEEASFEKAQLVPLGSKEPLLQWERTPPMADEGSQQASASYLLGEEGYARAELRLEWTSSGLESEPQLEVLLQVLADATARQLTALNSELAPKQRESHVPAAPTVHAPLTAEPLTAGKSHA